jgi:preprotein translocase subunit SecA
VFRREIARTQRIVDGQNFETRRTLWKYAQVVEEQRVYLQDWRQALVLGEAAPDLLAERRAGRHARLSADAGGDVVREVERRLTLLAIDRCWSDHLAEIGQTRDGIHLVSLAGKDPYDQFHARAREAFDGMLARVDTEIVEIFDRLDVTADGVDWEKAGLAGPSSTWTYLVTDRPFLTGPLAAMAARPSTGLPLAALYAPFWIVWGFYRRWSLWRRKKKVAESSGAEERI